MKGSRILLLHFAFTSIIFSQWNIEWKSNLISSNYYSGWLNYVKSGTDWQNRFYIIDENEFLIMVEGSSSTVDASYSFTDSEKLAGYQVYSLSVDLTGDDITEFYVLGYYGSAEPYRQRLKIFDITNSNSLLELDDENFYYTYPVIWDVDNDGTIECTLAKYDYPNFASYEYLVYNTGVTNIGGGLPAVNFKLKQNYPNPFNPRTNIEYTLAKGEEVQIAVFDIKGELITILHNGYRQPGTYTIEWDATNHNGKKVTSGAYFYQIKTPSYLSTKKMLLVK